jgi:ParB family chromosome partitioning protein
MKLLTALVPVKKISCNFPCIWSSDFLTIAGQSILESKGVINPIVVRRIDLFHYELVSGVLEYYAAVRAREIDPREGENITVFIMEPENEEALTKQLEIFRR